MWGNILTHIGLHQTLMLLIVVTKRLLERKKMLSTLLALFIHLLRSLSWNVMALAIIYQVLLISFSLMELPMSRMRAGFLLPCTHVSVLGMARSMLCPYFFQMFSKNVMNMPCFPSFLNPAATFGGQQHTSHRQCSNTTARFITMEFPLDLSSPLTVKWLGSLLHSCGFFD